MGNYRTNKQRVSHHSLCKIRHVQWCIHTHLHSLGSYIQYCLTCFSNTMARNSWDSGWMTMPLKLSNSSNCQDGLTTAPTRYGSRIKTKRPTDGFCIWPWYIPSYIIHHACLILSPWYWNCISGPKKVGVCHILPYYSELQCWIFNPCFLLKPRDSPPKKTSQENTWQIVESL